MEVTIHMVLYMRTNDMLEYPLLSLSDALSCFEYVKGSLFSWAGVAEGTTPCIRQHNDLIGNVFTAGIDNSILHTHDQNSHKTSK